MKIIQASIEHVSRLAPLFNAYRVFYKQSSNIAAAHTFLTERFSNKDSVVFMAIDSQENAVGFTQLYPSFSSVKMQRTYILNDLYVSENSRKKGIGEALMLHAKKYAQEHKSRGLTLETDADNPAQKLYMKLGWKKDTAVNHYTWETA